MDKVPGEIAAQILSYLDLKSILRFSEVSKVTNGMVKEPLLYGIVLQFNLQVEKTVSRYFWRCPRRRNP